MTPRRKLINIDEELDREINLIAQSWHLNGCIGIKKPDVLRLLIKKYKDEVVFPKRKTRSKEWFL